MSVESIPSHRVRSEVRSGPTGTNQKSNRTASRPTLRPALHPTLRSAAFRTALGIALAMTLASSPAMAAGWEGSKAEKFFASALDLTFVRPLAAVRVLTGVIITLPALVMSAPDDKNGFEGTIDVFVTQPYEYAFERKIGDF